MFGVLRAIYILTLGQDIAILQVNVSHTAYCHGKILLQRGFQPSVFLLGGIAKVLFFLYKTKIVQFKMINRQFVQLFFVFKSRFRFNSEACNIDSFV